MKRVLTTGMSGTEKSSVINALAACGYKATDTDDGWCEPLPDGRQRWRENAIDQLLATEDAVTPLPITGTAKNWRSARSQAKALETLGNWRLVGASAPSRRYGVAVVSCARHVERLSAHLRHPAECCHEVEAPSVSARAIIRAWCPGRELSLASFGVRPSG